MITFEKIEFTKKYPGKLLLYFNCFDIIMLEKYVENHIVSCYESDTNLCLKLPIALFTPLYNVQEDT